MAHTQPDLSASPIVKLTLLANRLSKLLIVNRFRLDPAISCFLLYSALLQV